MHLSLCPLLTIIVQQESSIPWKSSPPGKQWKAKSSWIYKVTRQKPGEKTKLQRKYLQIHSLGSGWSSQLLISQKTSPPASEITSGLITPVISNQCCLHLVTWCPATPYHPLSIYSTFPQTWFKMKVKLHYFTSLHFLLFYVVLCYDLIIQPHMKVLHFVHHSVYALSPLDLSVGQVSHEQRPDSQWDNR